MGSFEMVSSSYLTEEGVTAVSETSEQLQVQEWEERAARRTSPPKLPARILELRECINLNLGT